MNSYDFEDHLKFYVDLYVEEGFTKEEAEHMAQRLMSIVEGDNNDYSLRT